MDSKLKKQEKILLTRELHTIMMCSGFFNAITRLQESMMDDGDGNVRTSQSYSAALILQEVNVFDLIRSIREWHQKTQSVIRNNCKKDIYDTFWHKYFEGISDEKNAENSKTTVKTIEYRSAKAIDILVHECPLEFISIKNQILLPARRDIPQTVDTEETIKIIEKFKRESDLFGKHLREFQRKKEQLDVLEQDRTKPKGVSYGKLSGGGVQISSDEKLIEYITDTENIKEQMQVTRQKMKFVKDYLDCIDSPAYRIVLAVKYLTPNLAAELLPYISAKTLDSLISYQLRTAGYVYSQIHKESNEGV